MTDRRRLEDTITYLLQTTRRPLTRTALVKLLYFADLRSYERRGNSITGLKWIWHNFGPFSSEIYEVLGDLELADEVSVEVRRNYYGSPEYRIHPGPAAGYYQVLAENEQAILNDVIAEFSEIQAQRLAELSYYTVPMQDQRLHRGAALDFAAYSKPITRPAPYVLDNSVPRPPRMSSN